MNTYANIVIFLCACSGAVYEISTSTESAVEQTTVRDLLKVEENPIVNDTDVLQLIVGGQLITTIRSTLTRVPESTLGIIFNGRWENRLSRDQKGNIFLDFNPTLFHHLLEQLRLFGKEKTNTFYPPAATSLVVPFEKMLRKLGLNQWQALQDVIVVNAGGENLTIRQNILAQLSNLTANYFIDSDPSFFRGLISQLPKEQEIITEENDDVSDLPIFIPYNDGICASAVWNPNGITVAGGHGLGSGLDQLAHPMGLFIDQNSSIYVADTYNHRIMKWIPGVSHGQIIVGYNGSQNFVSSIVVDHNETVYFCDRVNNHVERWFKKAPEGEIILSDVSCWGLAFGKGGSLYISGHEDHRVIKWPSREIVAGGNGEGNANNQLSNPFQIFVDDKQAIHIADYFNHRIMKWFPDSNEGLLVAGGNGYRDGLDQLKLPHSVIVDQMGTMYIVDFGNDRIIRWFKASKSGNILLGKDGSGNNSEQFSNPYDIAFDREGNLYVADTSNHRIQMFRIEKSSCMTQTESIDQLKPVLPF